MRILYNNLLQSASLSGLYSDSGTSTRNLLDRILELKYLSTQTTDKIIGLWSTDQTISCISLGFHNLASASYTLRNSSGTSIGAGSLEVDYDTNMTYFAAVSGVRSIEVVINSSSICYLGGLSCGVPFSVEYHNVNPLFNYMSMDTPTWLKGGQTYGTRSKILEGWRATIALETSTERQEAKTMLNKAGNWFPVYADLYNLNHDEQRPVYGILQGDGEFARESTAAEYTTTIVIKEAR